MAPAPPAATSGATGAVGTVLAEQQTAAGPGLRALTLVATAPDVVPTPWASALRPLAVPPQPAGVNLLGGAEPGAPATVALPALSSNVRPALILKEAAARDLLAAAKEHDVGRGGCFSAGPAGVQVWSQPFDGPATTHGSSVHLGSIDWIYDTPAKNYATIYRAMTTAQGVGLGHTPETILAAVLGLTGLSVEGARLTMPAAPPRDPFRRRLG